MDLGVSSPQLDDRGRGFSLKGKKDGPLDLRMNQTVGVPASEWLQAVTCAQLTWVIKRMCYRLEPLVLSRISEVILQRQQEHGPYTSTLQLAGVLDDLEAELKDEHPHLHLTQTVFCALRVFLNREMEQLDEVMSSAFERLEPYGRCVIITFSRWELAAVRRFVRRHEAPAAWATEALSSDRLAALYPLLSSGLTYSVRRAQPLLRPTRDEIVRNPRSRSSVLHVLEKVPFLHPTGVANSTASCDSHELLVRPPLPPFGPEFEPKNS